MEPSTAMVGCAIPEPGVTDEKQGRTLRPPFSDVEHLRDDYACMCVLRRLTDQYIPPMPPPPGIGGIFSFSFFSTTTHSVVRSSPAMDAAFCSAVRVTLVGSMTPAATRSSYSSVSAL